MLKVCSRREVRIGFIQWDSLTQDFEYSNLGLTKSISELSGILEEDFT